MLLGLLFMCVAVCDASQNFSIPNVVASFSSTPKPFKINVDPQFIEDTRRRVKATRAPVSIGEEDDGPSLANFTAIRDYWVNEYNWEKTQDSINQRLKQFTTVVEITDKNTTIPVPLHFVHHTSPRDDAIPLLFLHGFPGSFLEVINIIDSLTSPPNASLPAFHVVAPSLPGFGFSPAPQHAGVGPVKSAQAFNALMQKLGYPQYVMQGGDFGGMILRYQANMFPKNVITAHSNFWVMMPSEYDIQNLIVGATSEEETAFITTCEAFVNNDNGFRMIQQSKPIQAAYALTDSPMGNCLWLYTLMQLIIDPRDFTWSLDEIITWSLMYYIQGPYGGMRMYKEMLNDGAFIGVDFADLPIVSQPVAISQFPYDALGYGLPLEWARRGGNVVKRYVHDHGGHFAAYEVPDLLLPDIWSWFGDKNTSGTSFFD
ncbi:hypothetical protein TGAMA5MH_03123 [Trichoderma gamsii]|uniref:Epoxide hydrolase N-terminal domain-containing protein n=1 Tax=Trichoderma gamsii TaxID=398673 RepID=A0A2K0THT2_9HYPO|nr:hypothetical protein TGAMA5MH_03123 [Trichoderma gamsii]